MIYGLIFTIYGVCFMFLLLMTVLIKKNKSSVRSSLYLLLMIFSILLGIFEILSVIVLIIDSSLISLFNIVWNIRNVWLFFYLFSFIFYYIELIKPSGYSRYFEYFVKKKIYLILFIFLCLFSVYYLFSVVPNNFSTGVMMYFGGKSTSGFLIVGAFLSISVILLTFYYRKKRKNLFQCICLVVILLISIMPFQIKYNNITLIPFALMFILYIIYYNIENPDIEYIEELIVLNDDINKSNNSRTEFLFNLSYDLLTSINSIISLCDSIIMSVDINADEIKNDVKDIKLSGNTLLDSINNVFDMSNNSNTNLKEYSLYELINRMKSISETRIGFKQLKFETKIDQNLSSKYIGDINKIQKVLLNILGNAIKFTEVGKILFDISFSVNKEEHILHFKISDTGNGIKDEEKSFIFSDSEVDKSGVGLAISKKYIEEMGGTIRFDSEYNVGTTFYIDLPQMVSGTKLISDDIENDNSGSVIDYCDLSNYRVLIVDDVELDIKVVKRLLEKYNLQIEICDSSVEFVDKIKRDDKYDLVFLDHKMNELDGVEAVKLLRQLDGYKLPVIVALTANVSDNAREYYKSVGFDEYLSKPVDKYEINKILRKFLK